MPACTTANSTSTLGRLAGLKGPAIDTTVGGTVQSWSYSYTGGTVSFTWTDMPVQRFAWSRLNSMEVCAW